MDRSHRHAVADRLARFDALVEVGVGRRPDVAARLGAAGCDVTTTDVHEQSVPEGVRFVVDDVTDPDVDRVYAGADAVYALALPPELHRPARDVARAVDAPFLFTTLGGDGPAVAVEREAVAGGTLYRAVMDGPEV